MAQLELVTVLHTSSPPIVTLYHRLLSMFRGREYIQQRERGQELLVAQRMAAVLWWSVEMLL